MTAAALRHQHGSSRPTALVVLFLSLVFALSLGTLEAIKPQVLQATSSFIELAAVHQIDTAKSSSRVFEEYTSNDCVEFDFDACTPEFKRTYSAFRSGGRLVGKVNGQTNAKGAAHPQWSLKVPGIKSAALVYATSAQLKKVNCPPEDKGNDSQTDVQPALKGTDISTDVQPALKGTDISTDVQPDPESNPVSGASGTEFSPEDLQRLEGSGGDTAWAVAIKKAQQVVEADICGVAALQSHIGVEDPAKAKKRVYECLAKELKLDDDDLNEFQGTLVQKKLIQIVALVEWERGTLTDNDAEENDDKALEEEDGWIDYHSLIVDAYNKLAKEGGLTEPVRTVFRKIDQFVENLEVTLDYSAQKAGFTALKQLGEKITQKSADEFFKVITVDKFEEMVKDIPGLNAIGSHAAGKGKSLRGVVNRGGMCLHWAGVLSRLIRTMFKGDTNIKVAKPRSDPHEWVRVTFIDGRGEKQCTHIDSFWASRSGGETHSELNTQWMFKTARQLIETEEAEFGKQNEPSHEMHENFENCGQEDKDV